MAVDRPKKVNVEALPEEQVDTVAVQLGDKIRGICDKACEDANKLLKIYGLQAKMEIVLEHIKQD